MKFALDNMYWMQKAQDVEELCACVKTILSSVPISFQDDYNHRIRKYVLFSISHCSECYKIFKKMLSKGIPNKEIKSAILKLSFSVGLFSFCDVALCW